MEEKKNCSIKIISAQPFTTEQLNQIAQILSKILPKETIIPSDMLDKDNVLKYEFIKEQAEDFKNELEKADIKVLIVQPKIEKEKIETKQDQTKNTCPHCGNEISHESKFCSTCGIELTTNKKKTKKIAAITILIIAIIIVALMRFYPNTKKVLQIPNKIQEATESSVNKSEEIEEKTIPEIEEKSKEDYEKYSKEDWKKYLNEGFQKIKKQTVPTLEVKESEDYKKYLDEGAKLFAEGLYSHSRKNLTEVINLCNKAIEIKVDSTKVGPYILLACCHFCLGNLQEGDKYLQNAFEINREASIEIIKTQVKVLVEAVTQIKSVKWVGNWMIIDEVGNVAPYGEIKSGYIISSVNNRRVDTPVNFLKVILPQFLIWENFPIGLEPVRAWMLDSKNQNEGKGSVSGTAFVTLGSGEKRPIVLQKFMLLPYNPSILYQWIDSSKGMVIVEEERKNGTVSGIGTFTETTGISFQEINDYYLQASYDSGKVFVASTDTAGNFIFENVRVGQYILTTYLPLGSPDIFGVPVGVSRVTWFVPVEVQAEKTINVLLDNSTGFRIPTGNERFDRAFEEIMPKLMKMR